MTSFRCLCGSCTKKCSDMLKSELVLRRKLLYIYLKNGGKITYSCNLYMPTAAKSADMTAIFLGREGMLKIV